MFTLKQTKKNLLILISLLRSAPLAQRRTDLCFIALGKRGREGLDVRVRTQHLGRHVVHLEKLVKGFPIPYERSLRLGRLDKHLGVLSLQAATLEECVSAVFVLGLQTVYLVEGIAFGLERRDHVALGHLLQRVCAQRRSEDDNSRHVTSVVLRC